ncbi:MAG: insulinase family protein [bacterium]|nr:insulinase family protein [bacterium]
MKVRRLFCGLGLAVCLAAAPAWAGNGGGSVNVTEFDLPNGLHVILKEDHTLPLITTDVMYKVGSAAETKGHTGFAHLFEHLMFCGSAHVGKGQFEELVHSVYGDCNASTHEDYTNYHITVPSNSLPMALFLESDRMGYFIDNMRLGIVDEQRDVVKNEHRQKHHKAADEILSALYPDGHPYSRSVMGSMDDLTAAEYADVVNFFKERALQSQQRFSDCSGRFR